MATLSIFAVSWMSSDTSVVAADLFHARTPRFCTSSASGPISPELVFMCRQHRLLEAVRGWPWLRKCCWDAHQQ
ncbi:hypothetical protein KL929_005223, partial [Ogataea haglerorum]